MPSFSRAICSISSVLSLEAACISSWMAMLFSCERLSFAVLISSVSSVSCTWLNTTAPMAPTMTSTTARFMSILTVFALCLWLRRSCFSSSFTTLFFCFCFWGAFGSGSFGAALPWSLLSKRSKSYAFDVDAILFPPFGNLSQQIQLYSLRDTLIFQNLTV